MCNSPPSLPLSALKCKKCGCITHTHCGNLMPYNCGQHIIPIASPTGARPSDVRKGERERGGGGG